MAPENGETIVARKRGLRPSELRNIQRQRVNNEGKGGIIPLLPSLESSSSRIPLASMTNTFIELDECKDQNSINRFQLPSKLDWSIKRQVNIILFNENPSFEQEMRKSLETCFTYWSFPYPPINQGTLKRISQLLLSRQTINSSLRPEEADERDYFKRICENWKAALVSLFANFQKCTDSQTGYFFYLHRSVVALFRRTIDVEVILANVTPFLEASLKDEGIRFEVVGKGQSDTFDTNCPSKSSDGGSISEEEDQENINPNEIKLLINSQLKRKAARKAESTPQGTKILLIQGDLHVRTLVDYLLNNQHDGPATPLLPELLAPWPFLYGTQAGVDVGVGSLVVTKRGIDGTEGRKHVQIGPGLVLPHALSRIVKDYGDGMESFVVGGIHQLSEPFSMLSIC